MGGLRKKGKKTMKTIQITQRDMKLLRWINAVGYVQIKHIAHYLQVSLPTAYERMQKLIHSHFVVHHQLFHGEPGVYRVTHEGVKLSFSPMPPLRRVNLATYRHDLMVLTVSQSLLKQYGGVFLSERQLRHEAGILKFNANEHMSDGLLVYDDSRIAIEVELTKKSKQRLEKIIHYYLKRFDVKEVWYLCGDKAVRKQIDMMVQGKSFFRVMGLDAVLTSSKHSGEECHAECLPIG